MSELREQIANAIRRIELLMHPRTAEATAIGVRIAFNEDEAAVIAEAVMAVVQAALDAKDDELSQLSELYIHACNGATQRKTLHERAKQAETERDQLKATMHNLINVAAYVSRGRRFVGVGPYPDALARRALGALDDDILHAALDQPEEPT